MNNQEAAEMIRDDMKLHHDYLSGTYRKALNMAISALQAQDSSVDLFPDLTIVEKAEIRGYVKGQLDAINDLVAAGLIEREKAISILKDHDLDEAGKDTISRQAAIDTNGLDEEIRCEMCKNPMHTDRGCDGNCKYDEKLYGKIMQILDKRIMPLPSAQPTEASCWGCNCPKMERLKEQKTFSEMVHLHDVETHDKRTMPSAQPEPLSDAYTKAVWKWLLDYQIDAAELKGRYTPYEVLSWVVNDWRKEHEGSD